MIAVTGRSTTIVRALEQRVPGEIVRIPTDLGRLQTPMKPPDCKHYVLAAGFLAGEPLVSMDPVRLALTFNTNLAATIQLAARIFALGGERRVCIVGSLSGREGSHDLAYAVSKGALETYAVLQRPRLSAGQGLALVLPTIIADSGMTRRRPDYPEVLDKRRTVTADRVAAVITRHLFGWLPSNLTEVIE